MIATGVCRVHDLRAGKPPEGQLDEGKRHEGGQDFGKVLETPVSSKPGKGAGDRGHGGSQIL